MSLKIEMLRSFVAVAQTGSLSDAAVRLGRTPSAISMVLKQLEQHLNQRLFETERKNKLTPLGEYVLETAQAELTQFDNTVRSIESFARTPQGLIRVAAVPSIAAMLFAESVAAFAKNHPNVTIELQDMDSARILTGIARGDLDIGIATATGALRGITQDRLFEDAFGLVCAVDHPLAQQSNAITMADIARHPFVQNELCTAIKHDRFAEVLRQTKLSARNTLSLIAILRAKPWVTILPQSVVQIDPQQLVFREIEGLAQNRSVDLLYRANELPEYLLAFVDFLKTFSQTSRF